MTDLKLTEGAIEDVAVVKVDGWLDVYTAPMLRQSLLRMDERGHSRILADLTGCVFLDSTGLGVIIAGLRRARKRGGDLMLVSPSGPAVKVFQITGLTKLFTMYDSRDEAVKAMAKEDDGG